MKKIMLALTLVSMLTFCFNGLSVSSARPSLIVNFDEVEAVPQENQINNTTFAYYVGVTQDIDPAGSWSWASTYEGKEHCYVWGQQENLFDCDKKTIMYATNEVDYSAKGATTVSSLVFADVFTQSGHGDYGPILATAETFEKMTVVCSADGMNWTEVPFRVAYHTQSTTYKTAIGKDLTIDTFWHLIFEEEIPVVPYFAIHTSEAGGWDAPDHRPTLGIVMDLYHLYLVKGDTGVAGSPVSVNIIRNAGETVAETTVAETTVAETTVAETTVAETTVAETTVAETTVTQTTDVEAMDTNAQNDDSFLSYSLVWIIPLAVFGVAVVVVVIVIVKKRKAGTV